MRGFITAISQTGIRDENRHHWNWEHRWHDRPQTQSCRTRDTHCQLQRQGEHRSAVSRYFKSEFGQGGMTGVRVPGRLNPRRVRCPGCDKISPVEAPKQKCSCAVVLPDPLHIGIGIDAIHSYGIATRNSDLSDRNQHPSGCELSVLTWSRCCDRAA
jgi:hypothetical protein